METIITRFVAELRREGLRVSLCGTERLDGEHHAGLQFIRFDERIQP
jgi:hypothetical protein